MDSLLCALRQTTNTQHERLHNHPILLACQKQQLHLTQYRTLLRAFYAPWKALLPNISRLPLPVLRHQLKERASFLEKDLTQIKGFDTAIAQAENPQCLTAGECLGVTYVLVGSSLGARTLVECIKTSLPNAPIDYMSHSPKAAGWPQLVGFLQQHNEEQYPGAVKAAQTAFEMIEASLNTIDTHNTYANALSHG